MLRQKTLFGTLAGIALVCFMGGQLIVHAGNTPSVPAVTFAPPVNYTVGTLPFANAIADFDGDGILDIAVVNFSSNDVSVLLGRGDGTFDPAATYTVGTEPSAITTVDLNNDGRPDIAVADEIGKTIAVLINSADGSGTFKPAVLYPAGQAPRGIVAADLRGIGKQDLIVANNLGDNITIFLGNGDGTLQPGVNYLAHDNPKSVAVGFFNNDNHLDIAVANHNTNDVSILMGNGDGTFQDPVQYAVGLDPRHVLVEDFNKDGKMDLATANGGESTVSILYGNGDGTFQPQVKYNASTSPRWLAIADYNNDGFADIATSNYNAKNVSILLGTGSSIAGSAFLSPQNIIVGNNPTGLAAGDLNGDGLPDIAVTIGGLPTTPNTLMAVLLNVPVTVSPSSLSFPAQVLATSSAPQTVTLKNSAPNSLTISNIAITGTTLHDYTQANNCGSALSANASCTINVTFTPTSVNNRLATLTITDSAPGGSQTVALSGLGTAVSFAPPSLTFGSQVVGSTSAVMTTTLTNNSGGSTVTITSLALAGTNPGDFALTSNTCGTSVLPKKTCVLSVTFTPTATGARSATISVADNAGASPQTVALTGTGTTSVSVSPTSLTFPLQVLTTASTAQPVTLTNAAPTALAITSIAVGGTNPMDFPQTNNCGTSLAGNSSCIIMVTFKPMNINHRAATLTITNPVATQTVALAGTSTAVSFSPTSLAFAPQAVGTTSAAKIITVTNFSGGTAVTISSLGLTGSNPGEFGISGNTCGTSIAPKKTCTISVTFHPTVAGAKTATVSMTDNGGMSPQTAPISGTGQ